MTKVSLVQICYIPLASRDVHFWDWKSEQLSQNVGVPRLRAAKHKWQDEVWVCRQNKSHWK